MRLAGHVARIGTRHSYGLLIGKSEGNRPLRRPIYKWVYKINMNLGEIDDGVVWNGLVWFRKRASGEPL
jgi:hypothetical protein